MFSEVLRSTTRICRQNCACILLCADNIFEPDVESLQNSEAALLNLGAIRRNSTREACQVQEDSIVFEREECVHNW